MFKITKLMMMVAMVGTLVVMSTGCDSSSDDDTVADIAGVWMVTVDGDTDASTITQDGHSLVMTDTDGVSASGEIYGTSVTFSMTEIDDGVLVTNNINFIIILFRADGIPIQL